MYNSSQNDLIAEAAREISKFATPIRDDGGNITGWNVDPIDMEILRIVISKKKEDVNDE